MNNSYITIIKEKRTVLSRKRVPLNQNECTADFRIGVPFEQNLHVRKDALGSLSLDSIQGKSETGNKVFVLTSKVSINIMHETFLRFYDWFSTNLTEHFIYKIVFL